MASTSDLPTTTYQSFGYDIESPSPGVEKTFSDKTPQEKVSHVPADIEQAPRSRWKRAWEDEIAKGRWPRVIYGLIGIIIGAIWVGITVYYANAERTFARNRDIRVIKAEHAHSGGIIMEGALKRFDQDASVLTVSWSGIYKDPNGTEFNLDWAPDGPGYPLDPWPIQIYRDVDTTISFIDNNTDNWYWLVKNASSPHIATIGNTAWDNFDTDIDFQELPGDDSVWHQPLFGYPLDKMAGNITFVASDALSASNFNVSSYVFPISGARLVDYSLNWRFDISYEQVCQNFTDFPDFVAAAQPLTNDTVSLFTFPCHITVILTASRPPLVQFAVTMAVLVNWTSTLFIFILTCESLIMRRGWMLSGTDLLGVTFTSLFALPTVRSLLPGAPDFGVLDLIGIIPNVIVISLCITAIAVAKLNRKAKHGRNNSKSE